MSLLSEVVAEEASIGVADGLFAAVLAARAQVVVPAGGTVDFLAPWSTATLARPTWRSPCSDWASPPWASWPHCRRPACRTGSGRTRPSATRWSEARVGNWPGCATAPSSDGCGWPAARIPIEGRRRRRRSNPASSGGCPRPMPVPRARSSRCRSGWGSRRCWWADCRGVGTPTAGRCWCPGALPRGIRAHRPHRGRAACLRRLPPTCCGSRPGPSWSTPGGTPWWSAGEACFGPDPPALGRGGPWEQVVAWAGPWPVTERWWSVRRRRARLQVVTAAGVARLLCTERGRWWVEALYD